MLLNVGAGAVEPGAGGLLVSLLPIILMVAVFYFIVIRPQRKRDKENRRCWHH